MPMNCQRCAKEAIVHLPYGPHHLCQEHFEYFFEHRVRKLTRLHEFFEEGERIAIAVSGGKDSIVALNLMKQIMPRHEIVGISIDEGIEGYRNKAIEEAVKNYKALDVEYKIIKLKDVIGTTMTDIVKQTAHNGWEEHSCSFCGVFRRKYINLTAKEFEADKLVTGHNLDDECQSIAMNFFKNDLERMARMGPRISYQKIPGFVSRVKPLYNSPEEEVQLFAQFKQYPHYSETCCPFSHQAKRNHYRYTVDYLEEKLPGTKNGMINSFLRMKPLLQQLDAGTTLNACKTCGELTPAEYCQACKFAEKIKQNETLIPTTGNPLLGKGNSLPLVDAHGNRLN